MSDKQHSIKLLRETNAGIQMGVSSLERIIPEIRSDEMKRAALEAKAEHDRFADEAHSLLLQYGSDTKEPHPAAKMMSKVMTNMKLMTDDSDAQAAELLTDGCDSGIKNLHKYLNEFDKADSTAVSLTNRVIRSEEKLIDSVKKFL